MENATQAMLIAAGVLIGVMVLSLGVALFSELNSYVESSNERNRFNELNAFNTQFLNYDTDNLTIHDIVTVAYLANESNFNNNVSEEPTSPLYVTVILDGTPIEANINNNAATLLNDNNNGKIYECFGIRISETTGRVFEINFREKTV